MDGRNQLAPVQLRRPDGRRVVDNCVARQGFAHIFHLHRSCCLIETAQEAQKRLVTSAMLRSTLIESKFGRHAAHELNICTTQTQHRYAVEQQSCFRHSQRDTQLWVWQHGMRRRSGGGAGSGGGGGGDSSRTAMGRALSGGGRANVRPQQADCQLMRHDSRLGSVLVGDVACVPASLPTPAPGTKSRGWEPRAVVCSVGETCYNNSSCLPHTTDVPLTASLWKLHPCNLSGREKLHRTQVRLLYHF